MKRKRLVHRLLTIRPIGERVGKKDFMIQITCLTFRVVNY